MKAVVIPSPIQCVVMARHDVANRWLQEWISRHRLPWRYGSSEFGVDVARNQNITQFLREDVPAGRKYLLMIDADMVPLRTTDAILRGNAPLTYCGYIDREGSPGHTKTFGAGCFRVSADGIRAMGGPPWFKMGWNDELTRRTGCECGYFARKARVVGVDPVMVGVIGHLQQCVVVPHANPRGYRAMWPHEVDDATQPRTRRHGSESDGPPGDQAVPGMQEAAGVAE